MKARALSSACLLLFALVLCGCGPPEGGGPASGAVRDDRLVVLGPSLVELMWELDLGDLIVAVDRYVSWPPELAALPRVGGYLDPSLEAIIDLHPTSIHSVGRNPDLEDLAFEAGLVGGYRTYRFDTLEDVFESARLLCLTYGEEGGYAAFAERVEGALDSLSALVEREGLTGTSVLLLITRVEGSGSTVSVGEGTFLRDVVERLGLELSAPDRGCYPTLSIESVVAIQPDLIIYLLPEERSVEPALSQERAIWSQLGFDPGRVMILSADYLLVPGPRLVMTASDLVECVMRCH